MGRKRFLTIVGSLMIGVISLIIVYLSLILTNVVVLTQADIEITTADAYKEYDGTPLSNNDWSLTKGVLGQDHIIEMVFTGSQLDAGTSKNTADIKIKTVNGKDVTKNYNITFKPGTLAVSRKPISIQSSSDEKDYDGKALKSETYEVKSGYVLDNHTIKATYENEITDAGVVDNVFTVRIYDQNMRDVTDNYDVNKTYGLLTVNKLKLEIQSANATKEYDGKPLDNGEYEIISGEILSSHRLEYTSLVEVTDVSKVENSFSVTIFDYSGKDQTKNYDVRYINGTLEVTKKVIRITTPSATVVYNGQELSAPTYTISEFTPVIDGHTLKVQMDEIKLTTVGKIVNRPDFAVYDKDGVDVTKNYQLDENTLGTLEIKSRSLAIKTYSDSKYFDGEPLTRDGYLVSNITPIPAGHTLEVSVEGSITAPGQTTNYFVCRVLNAEGEDVTYCFDIYRYYGYLYVIDPTVNDNNITTKPIIPNTPNFPDDYDDPFFPDDSGDNNPFEEDHFPTDLNSKIMEVQSSVSGLIYLRSHSQGDYTGKGFKGNPPIYNGDYPINPLYLTAMILKEAGYSESTISVKILNVLEDYHLPCYATDADPFTKNDYFIAHDFVVNEPYNLNYINYHYSSNKKITTSKYAAFEAEYRKFVYDNYLNLSDDVLLELNQIISANKINRNSSTLVEDVLKFVGSCAKYSLKFPEFPSNVDIGLYFLKEAEFGICQHFATAATILYRALGIPARYTVGYAVNARAYEKTDVLAKNAHAWVEIYIDGMGWVVVDPTAYAESDDPERPSPTPVTVEITVTPESASKQYDGTPLEAVQKVKLSNKQLKEGHYYEVVVGGSQTEVGKGQSYVESFIVYDAEGNDVTDQYSVTKSTGVLHVYKSKLVVKVESTSKIYDGTALTANSYEIESGLLEGHIILAEDVKYTGSITNVGTSRAGISLKIRDANTLEDVTDMYYIAVGYGLLQIKPIELIVTIGSAEKIYDGTALICHDFKVEAADPNHTLLRNHEITIVFGDSLTDIGYADNTARDVTVIDLGYGDVTRNYKITVIPGTLHVKPD